MNLLPNFLKAQAEFINLPSAVVFLVGAGPGDPGLITVRGLECLQQAQVVVYDRLVSPALLKLASQAQLIDVGKQPDHHPVPQEQINALLIEHARLGKVVVRLKGGDPFVFGRGGEEALALVEAGIPFEVVPGVSSAIAVPAYAGIPVTQRGMSCSFVALTGHRSEGAEDDRCPDSETLGAALSADTKVFMMGVKNLPLIVERLRQGGCAADMPAAVIARGTTPQQQVVIGTLSDIVERARGIRPPAIVVVGEVARLHDSLRWFAPNRRRPLLGLRVLNTRPQEAASGDIFRSRLAALGAEVLDLPSTRIAPLADDSLLEQAIHRLARPGNNRPAYDWILFTSATTVQFFFERLYGLGYDARQLAGVQLGAVGKATAQALGDQRLKADFTPTRYTGLDWAAQAPDLDGKRILLPRSEIAPNDLVAALESRGAQVAAVPAYTVVAASPDSAVLACLLDGRVDLVTLFSPSALNGLVDMLRTALVEAGGGETSAEAHDPIAWLNRYTLACIGPTTAQTAAKLGLRVDLVPDEHTVEGLLDRLIQWRVPS